MNFEGTNTYGATASWKDGRVPNKNQAGVQNLTAVVNYPGISTPVEIPIKVLVYNFMFNQPNYETEVGQTMPLGTNTINYYKLENGEGLPVDGFKLYWTGKNNVNWEELQEAPKAFSVNQTYDVIIPSISLDTWQVSQPAKFTIKNVRLNLAEIRQNKNGNVVITAGPNKTIRVLNGQKVTSADKLIVYKNNTQYFAISKNSQDKWQLHENQHSINGINFDSNSGEITFNYSVLNPGDNLKVVATQGTGEVISHPSETNNFVVKVPQPEIASGKSWDNGTFEIKPDISTTNNNPTEKVDISYIEKIENTNEVAKSFTITKLNNGRWSINNKPQYIIFTETNGKILFNANSIKPNSNVIITSRAGSGLSENSNNNLVLAPSHHEITINTIVKEQGDNITEEDVNNAIITKNKLRASIKNGVPLPRNLGGGTTTQIPVTITYNDNSTEEVNETVKTKVNKNELIAARNHLNDEISKTNKNPSSIRRFDEAIQLAQTLIESAKNKADKVINTEFATIQQVNEALSKVQEAQSKIDEAKNLLQNKVDNQELVTAKQRLEAALEPPASSDGMTARSKQQYNEKRQNAKQAILEASEVINNGDATIDDVRNTKNRVEQALIEYNEAKSNLRADKTQLEEAYNLLIQPLKLDDKKPSTVTAYNQAIERIKVTLTQAKNEAQSVLQSENPPVVSVSEALSKIRKVQPKVTQAINLLELKANNSQLIIAKEQLQNVINPEVSTTGMTQESTQNYHSKLQSAKQTLQVAIELINNGDASTQQINEEISRVNQAKDDLKRAKDQLTADITQLQNEVLLLNRSGDTNNKKPNSIQRYQNSIAAIENQINDAKRTASTIINKPIRTVAEVNNSLQQVQRLIQQLTEAINQLEPIADNSNLIVSRNKLETKVNEIIATDGMTIQSIENYNNAKNLAKTEIQEANNVINDSNVNDTDISNEISKLENKYNLLLDSINNLTVNREPLENAKLKLQQSIDKPTELNGKTADSINNYRQKLEDAKNKIKIINQILGGNPTVNEISTHKADALRILTNLNDARNALKVDKQPLEDAKLKLQQVIDAGATTDGMTQNSIDDYNDSLGDALTARSKLNRIIKGNPSVEEVNNAVNESEQAKQNLLNAKANLTPDKTPLETAKQALEGSINQQTDTEGMTQETLTLYNEKLNAAQQELEKVNATLNNNPTVPLIRSTTTEAKRVKQSLDEARSHLVLDRQPFIEHVNNEDHLNTSQKDKFKEQINSANNYRELVNIQNNANALNQAMKTLADSVANYELEKQNVNYLDGSNDKRQAYDDAVNAAKGILNQTQNPTMSSDEVNQKAQKVKQAKDALDGQQRLTNAKEQAINHLNDLHDLNDAQRQALTEQINHSDNITSVNQIKDNANAVNTAMTGLKQSVADNNSEIHQGNYINAE